MQVDEDIGAANNVWDPVPMVDEAHNNNNNENDNNNNENDVGDGEEEEDGLEEEEDPNAEDANRNADGSYDGGVAVAVGPAGDSTGGKRRSSDCDLVLFVECIEPMDIDPDHTILQPDVKVAIGLDKNTKLSAVFARYADFCNEHSDTTTIGTADLEFFHCTVLQANDTTEASALMKNDTIQVRKVRANEREAVADQRRYQRESDREYFKSLRKLMPDMIGNKNCDVVLDCRGKLVDENGLNQEVLRTAVRGHSAILTKRCKWLGRAIQCAREELGRRSVITIPEIIDNRIIAESASGSPKEAEANHNNNEDEDDGIEVLPYPINPNQQQEPARNDNDNSNRNRNRDDNNGGAAQIENDEDEDMDVSRPHHDNMDNNNNRTSSHVLSAASDSNSILWVTLPNHPPEAVKLLLEYCYTNRVIPLGHEAFTESCRIKYADHHTHSYSMGPVSPFYGQSHRGRRQLNNGLPTVSFTVALAGTSLAEEAGLPRLSLMCEVAASQLVTGSGSNFVEALSACSAQQERTGNSLPRLRRAAMDILLRSKRGVLDLCRTPTFRRALEERSTAVVPSLLIGTMEAVTAETAKHRDPTPTTTKGGSKRELSEDSKNSFDQYDRDDSYKRETERRKRRVERWKERGEVPDGFDGGTGHIVVEGMVLAAADPAEPVWSSETSKMSLKRMSHQLGDKGGGGASHFSTGRLHGQSSHSNLVRRRARSQRGMVDKKGRRHTHHSHARGGGGK